MAKYIVPVSVEVHGVIYVDADSPEEAIKLAKKNYSGINSLQSRLIHIDYAEGDDTDTVESVED